MTANLIYMASLFLRNLRYTKGVSTSLSYRITRNGLLIIVVITISFQLLGVINEPDLFWHLKSGEWIWQHKSFPDDDPFAFTTPAEQSSRKHFLFTSYWASQLLYHLLYSIMGLPALIWLRFGIAASFLFIMFRRKQGDAILYISLLFALSILFMRPAWFDRPQAFSFFLFPVLLYLLEKASSAPPSSSQVTDSNDMLKSCGCMMSPPAFLLIPFVMLFWANMHGGHILGQVAIIIYICMEGVKFLHPSLSPMKKQSYLRLSAAGCAGLLVSLANPNTYHVIGEFMHTSAFMVSDNIEYFSPWKRIRSAQEYRFLLYYLLLVLSVFAILIEMRNLNISEVTLLLGTGYYSLAASRFIPFFAIVAIPFISRSLSKEHLLPGARTALIVVTLSAALTFSWGERHNIDRILTGKWLNTYHAPEKAVAFIEESSIKGNMYNHHNYGGYLIWRLAPGRKVFIDGRTIDERIFRQAMLIGDADTTAMNGLPSWKYLLNFYQVTYIMVPLYEPSGQVLPLIKALSMDREWQLVFIDINTLVFIRDIPENADIMRRHLISKQYLLPYF